MNPTPDGASDQNPGTIKLIGIGQSLRGDDAAGLEAVRLWQAQHKTEGMHTDVQVELAELPGMNLLDLLKGARVAILVDAVQSGAKTGTIHILSPEQIEAFPREAGSAHGFGVAEALALGKKLMPSQMPGKLILIGIEGRSFRLGEDISLEVALSLRRVINLIEQLVTSEQAHQRD